MVRIANTVTLESIFVDIMDEVLEFVPEADHAVLLEQILQKLFDSGYELKELYGYNDEIDSILSEMYQCLEEEEYDIE